MTFPTCSQSRAEGFLPVIDLPSLEPGLFPCLPLHPDIQLAFAAGLQCLGIGQSSGTAGVNDNLTSRNCCHIYWPLHLVQGPQHPIPGIPRVEGVAGEAHVPALCPICLGVRSPPHALSLQHKGGGRVAPGNPESGMSKLGNPGLAWGTLRTRAQMASCTISCTTCN